MLFWFYRTLLIKESCDTLFYGIECNVIYLVTWCPQKYLFDKAATHFKFNCLITFMWIYWLHGSMIHIPFRVSYTGKNKFSESKFPENGLGSLFTIFSLTAVIDNVYRNHTREKEQKNCFHQNFIAKSIMQFWIKIECLTLRFVLFDWIYINHGINNTWHSEPRNLGS